MTNLNGTQDLINLLIEGDSLFQPEKFHQVSQQLRSLFRANDMLLFTIKREQVQVLRNGEDAEVQTTIQSLSSFQGSHFLRAGEADQVRIVPDLTQDYSTPLERRLLEEGIQSLLLIPLLMDTALSQSHIQPLMVLMGLTSDRTHNFDTVDVDRAMGLIPALRSSLRQAVQGQFSHIHPSVEWHFVQEAQRRTLGLPAEPIVFENVYPLYGISDIRGSSEERNRAIQADLLTQFDLGLAILDAVCQYQDFPLLQQLRLDFLAYTERLQQGVTVEDEVTAVEYLRQHLEIYFDFFQQCDAETIATVEAYSQSCKNEHGCVYTERDRYDRAIHTINSELRLNWERWQQRMQSIIPHYSDLEVTDGIDHMMYVGTSINPKFSIFHLHSLRYEQLRGMCDNGRVCFRLRDRYDMTLNVSHLVLVQHTTIDIFHDEQTEKLFDVQGTRDTRYEIVKKRIDKAVDTQQRERITQPGMLTVVYTNEHEWAEYQQYFRYLVREGWIDSHIESGTVEKLQGITGLKFSRVRILPE